MGRRPKTELTLTRPGGSATRTRSPQLFGEIMSEPNAASQFGEIMNERTHRAVMVETLLYGPPCFCGVPWGVLCGVLLSEALPESEGRLLYR